MTTVVVHNNTVYADGQATGNFISSKKTKKILNLGTAIVAGAGRWSHVVKFQNWIADTLSSQEVQELNPHITVNMPEKMVAEDFEGLVLYPDGVVIKFEGCDNSFEVEQPVFLGSGGELAAGCMFGCSDGYKAIEAAIELDPFSGGEIQVETFDAPEEELTKEVLSNLSKEEILIKIFGEDEVLTNDSASEIESVGVKLEPATRVEVTVDRLQEEFKNDVYHLTVFADGRLDDHSDEPMFTSFVKVCTEKEMGLDDLKGYAELLGVPFTYNISLKTLSVKVDKKLEEVVDSLNVK